MAFSREPIGRVRRPLGENGFKPWRKDVGAFPGSTASMRRMDDMLDLVTFMLDARRS